MVNSKNKKVAPLAKGDLDTHQTYQFRLQQTPQPRRCSPDQGRRQTVGETIQSLSPPSLPRAIDDTLISGFALVQTVRLELALDNVDGVNGSPKSVTSGGSVSDGPNGGDVATSHVVLLAVSLNKRFVACKVGATPVVVKMRCLQVSQSTHPYPTPSLQMVDS